LLSEKKGSEEMNEARDLRANVSTKMDDLQEKIWITLQKYAWAWGLLLNTSNIYF